MMVGPAPMLLRKAGIGVTVRLEASPGRSPVKDAHRIKGMSIPFGFVVKPVKRLEVQDGCPEGS